MKKALLALILACLAAGSALAQLNPSLPYATATNACGQTYSFQGGNYYDGRGNTFPSLPSCNPPSTMGSQSSANVSITGGTISATNSVTQGRLDNSPLIATDQFVNQQNASAVATVPFANVTGGTYNQATLGSGAQVVVFASGGVISSIPTVAVAGTGYAVGDLLALPAGNSDAVIRVTGVSSGGVTSAAVVYGGSGYTTGAQVTAMAVPPGRRAVVFTGTLTSNLTFIIQNGTYLTASREVELINNTTGAFTITVYLSNGADSTIGNGVVLPQGTNNSTAMTVYTDGVNDVWPSVNAFATGVTCSGSPTASFATHNGIVTHC